MQNISLRNLLNKIAPTDARVSNGTDFQHSERLYSACTLMNSLFVFFMLDFLHSLWYCRFSQTLHRRSISLFCHRLMDVSVFFCSALPPSRSLPFSQPQSLFVSLVLLPLLLFHFKVIKYFSNTLIRICCATEDINDFPMQNTISRNFTWMQQINGKSVFTFSLALSLYPSISVPLTGNMRARLTDYSVDSIWRFRFYLYDAKCVCFLVFQKPKPVQKEWRIKVEAKRGRKAKREICKIFLLHWQTSRSKLIGEHMPKPTEHHRTHTAQYHHFYFCESMLFCHSFRSLVRRTHCCCCWCKCAAVQHACLVHTFSGAFLSYRTFRRNLIFLRIVYAQKKISRKKNWKNIYWWWQLDIGTHCCFAAGCCGWSRREQKGNVWMCKQQK